MALDFGLRLAEQKQTKAEKRQKLLNLMSHPGAQASIMQRIANGDRIKDIADGMGVGYHMLLGVLRTDFQDEFREAKEAHAEDLAMRNLQMADDVEGDRLSPEKAKTVAGLRQWYMERAAPEHWGQKSTVNMNVKGMAGLHMEAIRELSRREEAEEITDAEYTEVEEDPKQDSPAPDYDIDNDPLL